MGLVSVQSQFVKVKDPRREEMEHWGAFALGFIAMLLALGFAAAALTPPSDSPTDRLAQAEPADETVADLERDAEMARRHENALARAQANAFAAPATSSPQRAASPPRAILAPVRVLGETDPPAETVEAAEPAADAPPVADAPEPAPSEPVETAALGEIQPAPPAAAENDSDVWLSSAPVMTSDGLDAREGLRFHVMTTDHAWVFGRADAIIGPRGQLSLKDAVSDAYFRAEACAAPALVALGPASYEGDAKLNHALADRRAEALAAALKETVAACETPPRIYAANLGENQIPQTCPSGPPCHDFTAFQRPVAIVSLSSTDFTDQDSLNKLLKSADVIDAAGEGAGFRLSDYDLFEAAPIKRL